MTSIGDSISIEELELAAADEEGIISDEATVLIVKSIFDRFILLFEVRNEDSVEFSLTLDRVKYECSASGYFGEVSKFITNTNQSLLLKQLKSKKVSPLIIIINQSNT